MVKGLKQQGDEQIDNNNECKSKWRRATTTRAQVKWPQIN